MDIEGVEKRLIAILGIGIVLTLQELCIVDLEALIDFLVCLKADLPLSVMYPFSDRQG